MIDAVVLAHDLGTSSVKSSIMKADGTTLDSYTTKYKTYFEENGTAEQDPQDWWQGIVANTKQLTDNNPGIREKIAGIGISGHMLGCLPVDKDGNVLHRHMLHADARAQKQFYEVQKLVGADTVYATTGNILDPKATLCKIMWVKENLPEVYAKTEKFLQSKDYIVYKLTGNISSTDFSDASHAQLLDVNKKAYSDSIIKTVGIDMAKLPEVHAGIDVVGKLTGEAAAAMGLCEGIPVVAGGGDGACANIGAGVASPGDTYCCLGTTAWLAAVVEQAYIDPKKRIFNIMTLDGDNCALFGTMQCAGRSIDWTAGLFDEGLKTFDELANGIAPGSDGLIYLPYLEGERSPIFDFNARGVFFGMDPTHTKAHFYRATMEGIAYNLRVILNAFREKLAVDEMRIIGGGAKSAIFTQIISDVCGVPIHRMTTPAADSTSLGAAVAAFIGAGVYPDLKAGVAGIKVKDTIVNDQQKSAAYEKFIELYQDLYPALKDSFAKLNKINTMN